MTDAADLDFFPFPTLGHRVRRRARHRRADRRLHAERERRRTPRPPRRSCECVGSTGAAQIAYLTSRPGSVASGQRRRHQRLHRRPEGVRRDHRRLPADDRPVPRPRHACRTSPARRHAGLPAQTSSTTPTRTSTRSWEHPGLLATRCLRSSSDTLTIRHGDGRDHADRSPLHPAGPGRRGGGIASSGRPPAALQPPDAHATGSPSRLMVGDPDRRSSSVLRRAPDARVDRPLVHELERHRRPRAHQVRRARRTTPTSSPSTRRSGRRSRTTSSGWASSSSSPRRSGCSWPCSWTRTSAAPASTRARCTCRSCCRWRSSASSGSSSTRRRGLHQRRAGHHPQGNLIDWLGDPDINLWAVLIAASWRQVGYVMILYLAGLKARRPEPAEAAAIDGANERQTFFRVVFPVLRPINIVILVITVIESLRHSTWCTSSTRASTAWSSCRSW